MPGRLWRVTPYALFIISGACGLVYEVTWGKYLALFLGNTSLAYMCVLASFMGGLALGSFVIGAASARIRRPLAMYGWLEVAIGLYAILFPLLIRPVESAVFSQGAGLGFGTSGWAALKLAASLAVLLLPTVLMGGTFPLLMRHFQPSTSSEHDKAEWLYTANCAGAVLGAMMAGFSLIPAVGLSHTLYYVGILNVVLGGAAVAIGARRVQSAAKPAAAETRDQKTTRRLLRPVYVAIAVSGATSMVYELVWIRIFAIALGGTTYAFTLMVSAFITGIAIGSLAVGAFGWLRRNALLSFAIAEAAIGAAVLASLPLYQRLPYVFWKWESLLKPSHQSMWLHDIFEYAVCFLAMVVPTIFFGASLPLAIKAVARRDDRIGRDSGFVYGANTLGTLVGALLTGFLLIPVLGSRHCLEWALVANVAMAALLLWYLGGRAARIPAIAAVPAVVVLVLLVPAWHPAGLKMGSYGIGDPPADYAGYKKWLDGMKVRYYGEDGSAAVAVYTADSGFGQKDDILTINGKPDASSYADLPTEVLLGQVPMMLMPDARDVLVIGLGSGVTAGSVLTHPDAMVDCVEISPAVVGAAKWYGKTNGYALQNPRLKLIVEDARTYVGACRKQYDVIVSEPSHPWVAGVANLFSVEFLKSADRLLKPGGLMVQWFQGYDISDELVGVMLRTLQEVFPYVYIFEGASDDYILVGSRVPIEPDLAAMERQAQVHAVQQDLARVGVGSMIAFLGRQAVGADVCTALAGEGPVNTDDRPILEYKAPVSVYADDVPFGLKNADQRLRAGGELLSASYMRVKPLTSGDYVSLILSYSDPRTDNPRLAAALLRYYTSRWPNDPRGQAMYSERAQNMGVTGALESARAATKLMPSSLTYGLASAAVFQELSLSHSVFTPQDFSPAIALIDRALQFDPGNKSCLRKRAEIMSYGR